MAVDRKRAISLNAADARTLLQTHLPHVLCVVTPAQFAQIQRVLDAEVVNPELVKEANEIYKKSLLGDYGSFVMRDEKMVKRANRLLNKRIFKEKADHHIRLDYKRLLTVDALRPVTDNPDEAEYLEQVRNTLETKGIWLRFDKYLVRDPEDERWITDPRTFRAWLALGYDGRAFPTKDGELDREELLGQMHLASGYYNSVDQGPTQRTLYRQIVRLNLEIDYGIAEHDRLIRRKDDAPIVTRISDLVGGADLPSRSIWDFPRRLLSEARKANSGGDVYRSPPFLVLAAIATRNNGNLLAEYAEDSAGGAGRMVRVLEVVKTATEVAEVALAVTGVAIAVNAAKNAARNAAVDAAAERMIVKHYAKDAEIMADLTKVKVVRQPPGSIAGNRKGGHSSGNRGLGMGKFP